MDAETAEAIHGAYGFARNVLAGIIIDLREQGASDDRIERLLGWIDQANDKLHPTAQAPATEALAGLQKALRASPEGHQ